MLSTAVRNKLHTERHTVEATCRRLRAAVEDGDLAACARRMDELQRTLEAHLSLVTYVIDALADDRTPTLLRAGRDRRGT